MDSAAPTVSKACYQNGVLTRMYFDIYPFPSPEPLKSEIPSYLPPRVKALGSTEPAVSEQAVFLPFRFKGEPITPMTPTFPPAENPLAPKPIKLLRASSYGITKQDIGCVARKGGLKYVHTSLFDRTRQVMERKVKTIVKELDVIAQFTGKNEVTDREFNLAMIMIGDKFTGIPLTVSGKHNLLRGKKW